MDLAELAVQWGSRDEKVILNAIGPETFTYRELVQVIGRLIGVRHPVISVPPEVGYWIGRVIGFLNDDVMITREEIKGLMANLFFVESPSTGKTKLTDWIKSHSDTLGRRYTSELGRRKDLTRAYQSN